MNEKFFFQLFDPDPATKAILLLFPLFAGVLILVVAYTVMGSILFMSIEGEVEESEKIETAVAASKPYPRNIDAISAELRLR